MVEVFPDRARSSATAVASSVRQGSKLLVSIVFPFMLTNLGVFVWVPFFAIHVFLAIFVYNCVIETKGKTIEEIEVRNKHFYLTTVTSGNPKIPALFIILIYPDDIFRGNFRAEAPSWMQEAAKAH